MKPSDKIRILREASKVQRVHTVPHHGSYDIGQHTHCMLDMLLVLHPSPSINLIKACQWHDVHERFLGDLPATTKWASGEFTKLYQQMVYRVESACDIYVKTTADERNWLDALDKTELLFWAKEQIGMGNVNAAAVCGNLARWFSEHHIPLPVKELIETYDIARGTDGIPG